ncbi:MAG: shikimate dehydrogenase [Elusimicrobiota bacterium]|nr:shikimate dehydrogenase [Elusimicrobiota bacterium]
MSKLKAGILGSPLNKSLSPVIFKFLFRKFNIAGSYERLVSDKTNINISILKTLKNNWRGFNITLPCKEIIAKKAHKLRGPALKIKTANVIKIERKKTIGYNTDIFGFTETIKENKLPLKNKIITLWGTGGAAKAVCWSLGSLKANTVIIHGRNKKRREELCRLMRALFPKTKFKAVKFKEQSFIDSDILINATPLGMYKKSGKNEYWNIPQIKKGAIFYDLAYSKRLTGFLKLGAAKKSKLLLDGKDMLIYQAIKSFEIWTGKKIKNILGLKEELKRC